MLTNDLKWHCQTLVNVRGTPWKPMEGHKPYTMPISINGGGPVDEVYSATHAHQTPKNGARGESCWVSRWPARCMHNQGVRTRPNSVIGTRKGALKTRAVRRLATDMTGNADELVRVPGAPWEQTRGHKLFVTPVRINDDGIIGEEAMVDADKTHVQDMPDPNG